MEIKHPLICIQPQLLQHLHTFVKEDNVFIIAQDNFWAEQLEKQLPKAHSYIVPEELQSLALMEDMLYALYEAGCRKDSVLLIAGDEAVRQIAGFLASSYYCGIPYLYLPLTKEAQQHCLQYDCTLALHGVEGIIGCVYAPTMILIDPLLANDPNQEQSILKEVLHHQETDNRKR